MKQSFDDSYNDARQIVVALIAVAVSLAGGFGLGQIVALFFWR